MHASTQRNSSNASRGDSQTSNLKEPSPSAKPPAQFLRGAELHRSRIAAYQAAAADGFAGVPFNHERNGTYTSPKHAAFVVGCWLRETGRTAPIDAHPSRGDLFKVNDMLLRIGWCHITSPVITREA